VHADITQVKLQPGDAIVLCSDGLHDPVDERELGAIAQQLPAAQACQQLIARAGGPRAEDNVTAVVLRLVPPGAVPAVSPLRRLVPILAPVLAGVLMLSAVALAVGAGAGAPTPPPTVMEPA